MALDYSQKRLISAGLRARNKRLRLYAFLTGLMSTVISLAHLMLIWMKGV